MMMKWRKLGVVWKPEGNLWWARSHATCPTPIWRNNGGLRVYIQCRDENNVGRVGYVDLDPRNPLKVLKVSRKPVLDIGTAGTFDDSGVLQTSIITSDDGRMFMYYVGFELCHRIRYRLLTGLAVSSDEGETFQRFRQTPILERSDTELLFRGGPFVMKEENRFRMWYVAGSGWTELEGKAMPVYDLRYIESDDGATWPKHGQVVLEISDPDEHGFGRPFVVKEEGYYRMFYSIRKKSLRQYRMGYAESPDGIRWVRKDGEMELNASEATWESDSVEFGAYIEHERGSWLLYNGNDFGQTGFGLAELVSQ
jgi:predicted GH43/DUF377 family glycosyl hydrolase